MPGAPGQMAESVIQLSDEVSWQAEVIPSLGFGLVSQVPLSTHQPHWLAVLLHESQSVLTRHFLPSEQRGQMPPQSVSVSVPSLAPLVHDVGTKVMGSIAALVRSTGPAFAFQQVKSPLSVEPLLDVAAQKRNVVQVTGLGSAAVAAVTAAIGIATVRK